MELLFSNNIIILFFIACIAIFTYTDFNENQRMFILYLFTYGVAAFSVFSVVVSFILLGISAFVFLEYLTCDSKKLELFVKLRYKIYDYLYLMFFQYGLLTIMISFFFLYYAKYADHSKFKLLSWICTIFFLVIGEQWTVSQPFKVKSITETVKIFDQYPPYMFTHSDKKRRRFDMICAFEDRSYFYRSNSYSCFSREFLEYKVRPYKGLRNVLKKLTRFLPRIPRMLPSIKYDKTGIHISGRGFSTPEMQLIRNIGVLRGYEQYKFRRKIYEIIYSKIILSSLKDYHQANSYYELRHFREYLLSVYVRVVLTRIKGKRYSPMASTFDNVDDIENWSLSGLFIACLGLSFRDVSDNSLYMYSDVIEEFGLNVGSIMDCYEQFPRKKFPAQDF